MPDYKGIFDRFDKGPRNGRVLERLPNMPQPLNPYRTKILELAEIALADAEAHGKEMERQRYKMRVDVAVLTPAVKEIIINFLKDNAAQRAQLGRPERLEFLSSTAYHLLFQEIIPEELTKPEFLEQIGVTGGSEEHKDMLVYIKRVIRVIRNKLGEEKFIVSSGRFESRIPSLSKCIS
jgi:hypothetical protein